ncbi:glycosyltransferase involved in cell wall biosynthesis [Fontibacillus phaseoli]|uniref:Glycosyltransferase involved in cell wall biosynthesis n=1 Tax=Fontibacillus phaseoli TaxID=1416533 RepID=A0A369BEN9_9BACL|nr:glycosyltransferase family 4 protein [Fontibacillus phaseoli]RCX19026.1 glycosyltransferase involved in cell wall biosynthesis [Fontibacillus phaseoli]
MLLKKAFPIEKSPSPRNIANGMKGVNLLGYSRAEMGIGESCRIAANNLDAVDIPFGILNFTGTNSARMEDMSWAHKEVTEPAYHINLLHVNAEQMTEIYAHYGNSLFQNKYTIGYWHWELPDFPDEWLEGFNLVDEVWVPSTFVADSVAVKSPVPVVKIPHSIEVKITEPRDRAYFHLPKDAFLFLSMYDVKSYQERKNPKAAVEAFKTAFKPDDFRVGLVLKVNSYKSGSTDIKALETLIGDYQNIHLITDTISRNDVNALLCVTDCFVSLHRSEGFGLGLAEAMYLGKPVIGTNWSSNTDFMDISNSCLVDYTLIQVGNDYGPYKAYQQWADPDVGQAGDYMKRLTADKEFYDKIALAGQKNIKENFSPTAVGKLIQERLNYIELWKFGGKS